MLVIPAIDIRDGNCVRLVEGKLDEETIYSNDPVEMAEKWQSLGAQYLHVVDLDGAFSGSVQNIEVIKKIVSTLSIPVQVGGGIRNMKTIDMLLQAGVDRVILGTTAISEDNVVRTAVEKYSDRIVLGIDARDGKVAVQGWAVEADITALDLANRMKKIGVERVVFTDIRRDGTLQGPNLKATGEMAEVTGLKVIASGGISSLEDIRHIKAMEDLGVVGAILGKALYTGKVNFPEALAIAAGKEV